MYDALLKKEERVRVCLENVRSAVTTFYQERYRTAGTCRVADDCIFEPYGGGFTVNVETYKKYHTCFMTFTDFEGGCWSILKGEPFSCRRDPSYPCFKAEPVHAPTHFACENNKCMPRYDGQPRKWDALYVRHFHGRRWYVDPQCKREFKQFQNQLKRYEK
jgi:hypothetical protein